MTAGPLDGVRVVDLTRLLPGPMCSWYLRGLGAQVTKVEAPGPGDPLRAVPPFDENGVGVWFQAIQAGTRSVQLDLRTVAAREALHWLLRDADVLLEGFRPGAMARLGLHPPDLLAQHPSLVIASISGFGQDGPLQETPGHDLGYLGYTGVLSCAALRADGTPAVPPVPIADLAGGALTAALSVTAALYERDRRGGTGKGRWVDVSMTDGALPLGLPQLAEAAATGRNPKPGRGLLQGGLPTYEIYRCREGGLVAVAAIEPQFQAELARVIGSVPSDRDGLADLFAQHTREHWAEVLAEACVTPILSPLEVLEEPLFQSRGRIVGQGRGRRVTPPFWGDHRFVHAPAPGPGAHTEEVLREVGAPDELIAEVWR